MKSIFLIVFLILIAVNAAFSQVEDGQAPLQLAPVPEEEEKKGDATPLPPTEEEGKEVGAPLLPEENEGKGDAQQPLPPGVDEEKEEVLPLTPIEGIQVPQPIISGDIKLEFTPGYQTVELDNGYSKAAEYRYLPEGPYIEYFSLNYESQSQEFTGEVKRSYFLTNIIDDGYWNLGYRRYGLLDVGVGLSRFPHDYGASSSDDDVSTQRDLHNFMVKFTPRDRFIIFTNLSVEDKKGNSPLTVENFTSNLYNSTAIYEIPEQIDYTTTTIELGIEYFDDPIFLQLSNSLQIFSNNITEEVPWNNISIEGATGSVKGVEDYIVHTLAVRPSIRFTENTRLENTVSYSKVTNSIGLIPLTTVSGVSGEFTKDTIDSDVRNLTISSLLSTRPLSDLRVNVKYRTFSFKNDTPKIEDTPSYVMIDGSTDAIRYPRIPRYTDYSTKSIGLDGAWSLTHRLMIDAGIEEKITLREEREVEKEKEDRLFISLNSTILDNLSGRFGYTYTTRGGSYNNLYYEEIYDPETDVTQHKQLRTYDLSRQNSNKITVCLDYLPQNTLNIGTALSYEINEYPDTVIGREMSNAESISLYAHYSLFQNLNLYSEYFYDNREMESKYSWTFDSNILDDDGNQRYIQDGIYSDFTVPYSEAIKDISNIYVIGFDYDLSQRISIRGKYSKYYSKAMSINLPDISSETDIYELKASYKLTGAYNSLSCPFISFKELRIGTGFYTEIYRRDNYAMDNIPETTETYTDKFLGILDPDYRLNIFTISLTFNF